MISLKFSSVFIGTKFIYNNSHYIRIENVYTNGSMYINNCVSLVDGSLDYINDYENVVMPLN